MPLPECYARREKPDDPDRVYCLHPLVHAAGDIVSAELCKTCNYWREPPPRPLRPFPPKPVIENVGRCVYLGEETGLRECQTCQGRVRVKVFTCSHPQHQETTLAECRHCPDHHSLEHHCPEHDCPEHDCPEHQPSSPSQADLPATQRSQFINS